MMGLLKKTKKSDFLVSIICVLIGGFVIHTTIGFPKPKGEAYGGGPGFYPQILGIVLIGLGGIILGTSLFQSQKSPQPTNSSIQRGWKRFFLIPLMIANSILFIYLMQILGFLIGGTVFLIISIFMIRPTSSIRDLTRYSFIALGVALFIYIIFEWLIDIALPEMTILK